MKELKGGTDSSDEVTDAVAVDVVVLDEVDTSEVTFRLEVTDEVVRDVVGESDVTVWAVIVGMVKTMKITATRTPPEASFLKLIPSLDYRRLVPSSNTVSDARYSSEFFRMLRLVVPSKDT